MEVILFLGFHASTFYCESTWSADMLMGPPFFQDTMLPLLALSFAATRAHMMSWKVPAYNSHHGSSWNSHVRHFTNDQKMERFQWWVLISKETSFETNSESDIWSFSSGTADAVWTPREVLIPQRLWEFPLDSDQLKPLKSELRYYCFTQPVLLQRGSQPDYGHLISYMIDNQWNTMIPPRFVWTSLLYTYHCFKVSSSRPSHGSSKHPRMFHRSFRSLGALSGRKGLASICDDFAKGWWNLIYFSANPCDKVESKNRMPSGEQTWT